MDAAPGRAWLSWIEPELAAVRCFAPGGTGHRSHAGQGDAIAAYLRRRNARAQPKHDFAPHSVTRTRTSYQNKAARRGTSTAAGAVADQQFVWIGVTGEPGARSATTAPQLLP